MRQALYVQDPTNADTTYLYESILAAAVDAVEWRGLYAFASQGGVDKLLEDVVLEEFFKRGATASITVGIDAVTNRVALERLLHFQQRFVTFAPTVFWTPVNTLFHPKISHFRYADGSQRLIVGSGNLTPGGLVSNFEAYSVISSEPGEALDTAQLDTFYVSHGGAVRSIDADALTRAAQNIIQRVRGRIKAVPAEAVDEAAPEPVPSQPEAVLRRVLVAQVPRAGGRWEQAHLNAAVINQFFRVTEPKLQRLFLTYVFPDGRRALEEPRRVVYSTHNLNYKVEIDNPGDRDYPTDGRPILLFVENGVRAFEYLLLMPNDPGHQAMLGLTNGLPSVGSGLPRVITDTQSLVQAWPQSPFFLPPI